MRQHTRKMLRLVFLLVLCLTFVPPLTAQAPITLIPVERHDAVAAELAAARMPAAAAKPSVQAGPTPAPMMRWQYLYYNDFEQDDGGMTATRDWTYGVYNWLGTSCESTPYYTPTAAYSGSRMWGTRLNDCYQNLGNNQGYSSAGACANTIPDDDSVLSFTVNLSGVQKAVLTWFEWYDVFSYWDWGEVVVNGITVYAHCESSYVTPTAWQQVNVDLTSFTGGPVTIEFHMMASTVVNKSGWFIDNVSVSAPAYYLPMATKGN